MNIPIGSANPLLGIYATDTWAHVQNDVCKGYSFQQNTGSNLYVHEQGNS